jgi:ABC-type antimicrobial peptide transport system permease subunit
VAQVSAVNGLPLDGGLNDQAGAADRKDQLKNSEVRFVTPGYFKTVGTTVFEGEDLSAADAAETAPVALINDVAAKRWFPGKNAVGEYVVARKMPRRVIGVTASTHNRTLAGNIRPTVYLPIAQLNDKEIKMINGWFPTTFVIRAQERAGAADPNIAKAAEAAIAAVDPEVPAAKFAPMQSFVDKSVAAPRFFSWLAGGFAVFALGLTLIGLFGLLSYQVSSRTRELGVRMALGAQRGQILSLVLRNGLVVTSIGLVLGIAGSFALRGVISSLLYTVVDGLGRADSVSILGNRSVAIALSAAAMLIATVAASLIPARRAAYLEPTEALRAE